MIYEEMGYDPKDLSGESYPLWMTKEIECKLCGTKGSIEDRTFVHVCEGEPIPFMDYVICQICGKKQLL